MRKPCSSFIVIADVDGKPSWRRQKDGCRSSTKLPFGDEAVLGRRRAITRWREESCKRARGTMERSLGSKSVNLCVSQRSKTARWRSSAFSGRVSSLCGNTATSDGCARTPRHRPTPTTTCTALHCTAPPVLLEPWRTYNVVHIARAPCCLLLGQRVGKRGSKAQTKRNTERKRMTKIVNPFHSYTLAEREKHNLPSDNK